MPSHTNSLINSTSPYLLQHAHNPVDWEEWNPEVLKKAKELDKPILVSIGYSSCHWCHVMEKESFEDIAIAGIMNENFINIKVDREERPDVDHVYMDAVQAMGLQGGWPLNVFLTPDQKPFYGGTYFPKKGWTNLLLSITDAFNNNRQKLNDSAEAFTKNLQLKESEKYKLESSDFAFNTEDVNSTFQNLSRKFDTTDGGVRKSPKFPMPALWQFLANYHYATKKPLALSHFKLTLEKMGNGGIYDHIGGGFARYSTDAEWHIPHFEKMLYDNGQLLSLYATGFKLTKQPQFKQILNETVAWLEREMLDDSGGFYSALDADSEGEEGKFYVWSFDELKTISGDSFEWLQAYFDIHPDGNWEGKNALRIVMTKEEIMEAYQVSEESFDDGIQAFKAKALTLRNKRVKPGLDNKIIAGWNGLTLTGLCHTFQATKDNSAEKLAIQNAAFIKSRLIKNGRLNRFPDKELEGFLEDYGCVIQAFITYYETTFDRSFLELALHLTQRVNDKFWDDEEELYFYSSVDSENLIARKKELFDNVISSSNSIMAWNLVHLGTHLYNDELVEQGKSLLAKTKELTIKEPEFMGNWASLAMELAKPFAEVIIIGPKANQFANQIKEFHIPHMIISGTTNLSKLPPFEHKKMIDDQTTIYVCHDKSCKTPVTTFENAVNQLELLSNHND